MRGPFGYDNNGHGIMAVSGEVVFLGDKVVAAVDPDLCFGKVTGTLVAIDKNLIIVEVPKHRVYIRRKDLCKKTT